MFVFATLFPALTASGFSPDANALPLWLWAAISAVGSAIAGAIYGSENGTVKPLAAAGFVTGFLVVFTVDGYVQLRSVISHTFVSIEFFIPYGIAMIPGAMVFSCVANAATTGPGRGEIALPTEDPEHSHSRDEVAQLT